MEKHRNCPLLITFVFLVNVFVGFGSFAVVGCKDAVIFFDRPGTTSELCISGKRIAHLRMFFNQPWGAFPKRIVSKLWLLVPLNSIGKDGICNHS